MLWFVVRHWYGHLSVSITEYTCAGPECFVREYLPTLDLLFQARREDPNTTESRPSSTDQQNAVDDWLNIEPWLLDFYRGSEKVLRRNSIAM